MPHPVTARLLCSGDGVGAGVVEEDVGFADAELVELADEELVEDEFDDEPPGSKQLELADGDALADADELAEADRDADELADADELGEDDAEDEGEELADDGEHVDETPNENETDGKQVELTDGDELADADADALAEDDADAEELGEAQIDGRKPASAFASEAETGVSPPVGRNQNGNEGAAVGDALGDGACAGQVSASSRCWTWAWPDVVMTVAEAWVNCAPGRVAT